MIQCRHQPGLRGRLHEAIVRLEPPLPQFTLVAFFFRSFFSPTRSKRDEDDGARWLGEPGQLCQHTHVSPTAGQPFSGCQHAGSIRVPRRISRVRPWASWTGWGADSRTVVGTRYVCSKYGWHVG